MKNTRVAECEAAVRRNSAGPRTCVRQASQPDAEGKCAPDAEGKCARHRWSCYDQSEKKREEIIIFWTDFHQRFPKTMHTQIINFNMMQVVRR